MELTTHTEATRAGSTIGCTLIKYQYSGKLLSEKTFVNWQSENKMLPKDTAPPNFAEKTFENSYKTLKVFSLKASRNLQLPSAVTRDSSGNTVLPVPNLTN